MKKIGILIPAFNEGSHIGELLRTIRSLTKIDINVFDDGSDDKTYLIAKKYADNVYKHEINYGKGKTLLDGIKKMQGHYEYAVLMDADGQHRPMDIKSFTDNDYKKYDIIIGKRDMNLKNMPFDRYFTNRLTTLITSIFAKTRTYDSQSGFRMVKINSILNLPIKTFKFQMESEMLIKAGIMGMKIGKTKVKTVYGDEISKINPIKDTLRFIKMTLEVLWL